MKKYWYSPPTQEFITVLEQSRLNAEFVQRSYRFISLVPKIVSFEFLNHNLHHKSEYQRFLQGKSAAAEDMFAGIYVGICAAYERFIRVLILRAVTEVNRRSKGYETVPESIRNHNTVYSGHALARFNDPPRHLKIDFARIIRDLGTCTTGEKTFSLNADTFSIFLPNLNATALETVLKRVCVETLWTDFGKSAEAKSHFDTRKSTQAKKLAKEFLNDFIETRNHIVHRGDGLKTVVDSLVSETIAFFEMLSTVLPRIVDTAITQATE